MFRLLVNSLKRQTIKRDSLIFTKFMSRSEVVLISALDQYFPTIVGKYYNT